MCGRREKLGLAGLFPLPKVNPIDLPAVARLGKKQSKTSEVSKSDQRAVLGMFANFMRGQKLTPVLSELAVISDKIEWRRVVSPIVGRQFVSLIDTYDDYLSRDEQVQLVTAWVQAIESLTNVPPGGALAEGRLVGTRSNGNFIVLNERVYDDFSHRVSMSDSDCVPAAEDMSTSASLGQVELPLVRPFELPHGVKPEADEKLAGTSIHALTSRTLAGLPHALREKIARCFLVILPFSRPYLEPGNFWVEPKEGAKPQEGPLFATYPESEKDPGGCFFAIYHAESIDQNAVRENERRFFLQAQYLLALSSLVEARKNLLLYYEDQLMKDWGHILHQFRNDLDSPLAIVGRLKDSGSLNDEEREELDFVNSQLTQMYGSAELTVNAVKARNAADAQGRLRPVTDTLSDILNRFDETITASLKIACKAHLYKTGQHLHAEFQLRLVSDFAQTCIVLDSKELSAEYMQRELVWINDYHTLICHELCRNFVRHARREDETSNVVQGKWALVQRDDIVRLLCENEVNPNDGQRVRNLRALAERGQAFKHSTGLYQIRLGMSVDPDLMDDIDLEFHEAQGQRPVFQLSIPIGRLV